MMPDRYDDRRHAGEQLAAAIHLEAGAQPVILALPRGGVEVAEPVAEALGAPLDVLVVRKLGVPGHPELAFGAIGEGGATVVNRPMVERLGLSEDRIADVIAAEREELRRRVAAYRGDRPATPVDGRTAIVVDDGLATGASAAVALQVLRRSEPRSVVLAVPVGPPETVASFLTEGLADDVVCPLQPRSFMAVGAHYRDFSQTTDEQVMAVLAQQAGR